MAADLVKLRYFVGMSMPEAAEALGMPLRNAERLWTAPAATGTFTNLSGATSPYTNVISGPQQFFRLKSD